MSDIVQHKPTITSVTQSANELIETSEPTKAQQVQKKLDSIVDRYGNISTVTRNHGEYLDHLAQKLGNFEDMVEKLEDWLLPAVERLESKQLGQMEPAELERVLQVRPNHWLEKYEYAAVET